MRFAIVVRFAAALAARYPMFGVARHDLQIGHSEYRQEEDATKAGEMTTQGDAPIPP